MLSKQLNLMSLHIAFLNCVFIEYPGAPAGGKGYRVEEEMAMMDEVAGEGLG